MTVSYINGTQKVNAPVPTPVVPTTTHRINDTWRTVKLSSPATATGASAVSPTRPVALQLLPANGDCRRPFDT